MGHLPLCVLPRLTSVSLPPRSDGRIAAWFLTKSELKMEVIMALKLMPTVPPALAAGPSAATVPSVEGGASVEVVDDARAGGLAGGCCFAFNPFFPSQMLLGTEEGRIHAMSLDYAGQYSGTYEGHHMAVYAIVWNPFHPRVFASSSADWTVRLWDSTCPTSFMVRAPPPPALHPSSCAHACPLPTPAPPAGV